MTPVAHRAPADVDPRTRSTPELLDHIIAHHHEYLREALPYLQGLAPEVARRHGERDARLRDLDIVVDALVEALIPHLVIEEQTLFPALLEPRPDRGLIARELSTMQRDHRAVEALLAELRVATDDFAPSAWACDAYRALTAELAALDADLRIHVHLEDDVLAPRFAAR